MYKTLFGVIMAQKHRPVEVFLAIQKSTKEGGAEIKITII